MASSIRWTEKQLQQHLARRNHQGPSNTLEVPNPTKQQRSATGARKTAIPQETRVDQAIATIVACRPQGHHIAAEHFKLTLPGVKLLSLNELHALHHYKRRSYKKACHRLIADAVLEMWRGTPVPAFSTYVLIASRSTPRGKGADLDALPSYFKYMIDGLRYAGVLVDDSPQHMLQLRTSQHRGPHAVTLEAWCPNALARSQPTSITPQGTKDLSNTKEDEPFTTSVSC